MKKLLFSFFLVAGFVFYGCKSAVPKETTESSESTEIQAETNQVSVSAIQKYPIKSAIVTFETEIAGMKGKTILYIDNYGSLEMEEKYSDDVLTEADLCDGANRYTINYKKKTAYTMSSCTRGIAYKFDWNEISDADKKEKAKKLPNITIAGKDCESYSYTTAGVTSVFAGWNNILLMQDQKNQYGGTLSRAISIEENAVIPAEKFAIPADIEIKPGI